MSVVNILIATSTFNTKCAYKNVIRLLSVTGYRARHGWRNWIRWKSRTRNGRDGRRRVSSARTVVCPAGPPCQRAERSGRHRTSSSLLNCLTPHMESTRSSNSMTKKKNVVSSHWYTMYSDVSRPFVSILQYKYTNYVGK